VLITKYQAIAAVESGLPMSGDVAEKQQNYDR
jgi:hypothetical protein